MGKILIFFLLLLDLQGKVAIIKSLWIHNSFLDFFFNTLLIWVPWRTKINSVLNKLKVYKKISCSIFFFFFLVVYFCFVIVWSDIEVQEKQISQRLIWAYNIVMLLWCVLDQKALLPRSSKLLPIFPGGRSHFLIPGPAWSLRLQFTKYQQRYVPMKFFQFFFFL